MIMTTLINTCIYQRSIVKQPLKLAMKAVLTAKCKGLIVALLSESLNISVPEVSIN